MTARGPLRVSTGPQAPGELAAGAPTPVLFIAGAGRSGRTLLDRVIGAQEGFLSLGEVQFIWQRSFAEDQLCGCGRPFHRCAFWAGVCEGAWGTSIDSFPTAEALGLKT